MGNITTYTIGISNYMFSIDNTSDLDAHYVIHTANLKAEGVRQGKCVGHPPPSSKTRI